jgi:hypothetical protein
MGTARALHTATLMPDGAVLVTGGGTLEGSVTMSPAELYQPVTATWIAVGSMRYARAFHTAVLLRDSTLLVAGGRNAGGAIALAEVFRR